MWLNDSYDAIHARAATLVQEGKLEEAVAEYRRIVDRLTRLSPATLESRPEMAQMLEHAALEMIYVLQRLESYDRAIEVIQSLATAFPERSLIWQREIAVLKSLKGETDVALSEMKALVLQAPMDPSMRWALAQILSERGEFDSAREQLIQSIDLAPDNESKAIGYRYLGDLYVNEGNVDRLAQAWDMVIALDPKNIENIQFVYRQLLRAGKVAKARIYIEKEKDAHRRGLYAGIASLMEGDEGSARAQWRRVFRQKLQSNEEATDAWAEAGLRLGEPQQVLGTLMPMLSNDPVSLRTLILMGIAAAMVGDEKQADVFFSNIRKDMMPFRDMLLPTAEWNLMRRLVPDEALRERLKSHFDTGEAAPERPAATTEPVAATEPQDE